MIVGVCRDPADVACGIDASRRGSGIPGDLCSVSALNGLWRNVELGDVEVDWLRRIHEEYVDTLFGRETTRLVTFGAEMDLVPTSWIILRNAQANRTRGFEVLDVFDRRSAGIEREIVDVVDFDGSTGRAARLP